MAVRQTLIKVCRGEVQTAHRRRINYKALWEKHSPDKWGQGQTPKVVNWIVPISNYDVEHGRPPLNSLVVRIDTGQPGDDWHDWNKGAGSPYNSLSMHKRLVGHIGPRKESFVSFNPNSHAAKQASKPFEQPQGKFIGCIKPFCIVARGYSDFRS
jgi:hypothetical protein